MVVTTEPGVQTAIDDARRITGPDWISIRRNEIRDAFRNLVDLEIARFSDREKVLRAVIGTFDSRPQAKAVLEQCLRWIDQGYLLKDGVEEPPAFGEPGATTVNHAATSADEAELDAIRRDWRFAFRLLEDPVFASQNFGKQIAVFEERLVGIGDDDDAARAQAFQTLGREIPSHRLVIAGVDDA